MGEKPWHDPETLRELHEERGYGPAEIAGELGCSQPTASRWLDRLQIRERAGESFVDTESEDAVSCPTCGAAFGSEGGMKRHHAHVHGESIAKTSKTCEYCGDEWEDRDSRMERSDCRFCSTECLHKWRSENERGEDHHQYSRMRVECSWCGDSKLVKKSRTDWYEHHFCGRECQSNWQSENFLGENHPNWEGGYRPHMCGFTDAIKEAVRERDGRRCVDCGMAEEEHVAETGKKLHVHHIRKARAVQDAEERNAKENLVTLCYDCHLGKWEKMSPLRPQLAD